MSKNDLGKEFESDLGMHTVGKAMVDMLAASVRAVRFALVGELQVARGFSSKMNKLPDRPGQRIRN